MSVLKHIALWAEFCLVSFLWGCQKTDSGPNSPGTPLTMSAQMDTFTRHPGDSLKMRMILNSGSSITYYGIYMGMGISDASMGSYKEFVNEPSDIYHLDKTFIFPIPQNFIGRIRILFIAKTEGTWKQDTQYVNVTSNTGPMLNVYRSVKFSNYADTAYGNFFSFKTARCYTRSYAALHQADIDLVFFIGSHSLATLAAPADTIFGPGRYQQDLGIASWKIRNGTYVEMRNLSVNNITCGYDIDNFSGWAYYPETMVYFLETGNLVIFKTAAGKCGMIKILGFTPDANSSGTGAMTADVYLEK